MVAHYFVAMSDKEEKESISGTSSGQELREKS